MIVPASFARRLQSDGLPTQPVRQVRLSIITHPSPVSSEATGRSARERRDPGFGPSWAKTCRSRLGTSSFYPTV